MPITVQYGSPAANLGAAYRAGELQGDIEARDKARKELMDRDRLNLDRQRFMQGVFDAQLNREYQGRAAIWGNEQAKQREADRQHNVLAAQRQGHEFDLERLGVVNEFRAKDRAADLEIDIAAEKRAEATRIDAEKRAWEAKVKEADRARLLAIEKEGVEAVERGADERLKFVEDNAFHPDVMPMVQELRAELARIRSDPHNAKATHPKVYAAWMQQWQSKFDNLRLWAKAKKPPGLADEYGKTFLAFDENKRQLPSFEGARFALVPNGYKFEEVGKDKGDLDSSLYTEARKRAIQKKATAAGADANPASIQNPSVDEIRTEYLNLQLERQGVMQGAGPQSAAPQVAGAPQQAPQQPQPQPQQAQPQPPTGQPQPQGQPPAAPIQIPQTPPSHMSRSQMVTPQGAQEWEQHIMRQGIEDAKDPRKQAWARDYYADIQRKYPNLQSLDMLPKSERDGLDRALRILKGIAILQQQQQQQGS